jgi:hypothetical protein
MCENHTMEFSLPGLQEPSTGPCSELYDWSMPSHLIVLRFSWIFFYHLCLGLPSGVLIWGHCVLEIQCVNVCLYWNYYSVVTSRTVFWGFMQFCENVVHYVCDNEVTEMLIPLDKTHSCLGPSTCYSDGIVSFFRQIPSKLSYPQYQLFCQLCHSLQVNTFTFSCPQCYQPFWWLYQFLQANTFRQSMICFIQSLSCMYVITESYYITCVISMA